MTAAAILSKKSSIYFSNGYVFIWTKFRIQIYDFIPDYTADTVRLNMAAAAIMNFR